MPALTKLHQWKKPVQTAHRGVSFEDAENMPAAFGRAVKCGTDLRKGADFAGTGIWDVMTTRIPLPAERFR